MLDSITEYAENDKISNAYKSMFKRPAPKVVVKPVVKDEKKPEVKK